MKMNYHNSSDFCKNSVWADEFIGIAKLSAFPPKEKTATKMENSIIHFDFNFLRYINLSDILHYKDKSN